MSAPAEINSSNATRETCGFAARWGRSPRRPTTPLREPRSPTPGPAQRAVRRLAAAGRPRHRLHRELDDPDEALRRLADLCTDRARAHAFAQNTGLYADPFLATGYRVLADEYEDGVVDSEIAMTAVAVRSEVDEEEARWIGMCLDALQVFDREGAQLRLDPLLRECVTLHL